jgi:hypothetical protein
MKLNFTVRQGALDGAEAFLNVAGTAVSVEQPRSSG